MGLVRSAGRGGFTDPHLTLIFTLESKLDNWAGMRAAYRPGGHSPNLRECGICPFTDEEAEVQGGGTQPQVTQDRGKPSNEGVALG